MNFNFELILFYATLITGVIALFDIIFLAPKRKQAQGKGVKPPIVLDYARSFLDRILMLHPMIWTYCTISSLCGDNNVNDV